MRIRFRGETPSRVARVFPRAWFVFVADFHTVPLTAIGLFSVPLASTIFYRTPMVFWHLDREMILCDTFGSHVRSEKTIG